MKKDVNPVILWFGISTKVNQDYLKWRVRNHILEEYLHQEGVDLLK